MKADVQVVDDKPEMVVRIIAETKFDELLLRMFEYSTPTFSRVGFVLEAVLRKSE